MIIFYFIYVKKPGKGGYNVEKYNVKVGRTWADRNDKSRRNDFLH